VVGFRGLWLRGVDGVMATARITIRRHVAAACWWCPKGLRDARVVRWVACAVLVSGWVGVEKAAGFVMRRVTRCCVEAGATRGVLGR
jgi:hypothetical protein